MIYRTQAELDAALAKWQKILRLQDWEITAEFMDFKHPDADNGGTLACITRSEYKQRARILVLRADDLVMGTRSLYDPIDMEESLVHELVHAGMALFEPSDTDSVQWSLCERFVDNMARTLIRLDRGKD